MSMEKLNTVKMKMLDGGCPYDCFIVAAYGIPARFFFLGGGVKENPYFLQVFKTLFKDRFVVDDAQFSPKLQLSTLDKFNMDFFNSIFVFHETCDLEIGDPRSFFHYSSVHAGTNIFLGCMLHGIF